LGAILARVAANEHALLLQIAKQQQQLIQQQHKINLLQQQIQVSSSQDLSRVFLHHCEQVRIGTIM